MTVPSYAGLMGERNSCFLKGLAAKILALSSGCTKHASAVGNVLATVTKTKKMRIRSCIIIHDVIYYMHKISFRGGNYEERFC